MFQIVTRKYARLICVFYYFIKQEQKHGAVLKTFSINYLIFPLF